MAAVARPCRHAHGLCCHAAYAYAICTSLSLFTMMATHLHIHTYCDQLCLCWLSSNSMHYTNQCLAPPQYDTVQPVALHGMLHPKLPLHPAPGALCSPYDQAATQHEWHTTARDSLGPGQHAKVCTNVAHREPHTATPTDTASAAGSSGRGAPLQ